MKCGFYTKNKIIVKAKIVMRVYIFIEKKIVETYVYDLSNKFFQKKDFIIGKKKHVLNQNMYYSDFIVHLVQSS